MVNLLRYCYLLIHFFVPLHSILEYLISFKYVVEHTEDTVAVLAPASSSGPLTSCHLFNLICRWDGRFVFLGHLLLSLGRCGGGVCLPLCPMVVEAYTSVKESRV